MVAAPSAPKARRSCASDSTPGAGTGGSGPAGRPRGPPHPRLAGVGADAPSAPSSPTTERGPEVAPVCSPLPAHRAGAEAALAEHVELVFDTAIRREYEDVLRRPELALPPGLVDDLFATHRRIRSDAQAVDDPADARRRREIPRRSRVERPLSSHGRVDAWLYRRPPRPKAAAGTVRYTPSCTHVSQITI